MLSPQLMDPSPSNSVELTQGVSFTPLRLEPIVEQEKPNRSQEVCKNKAMTNKEFGKNLEELSNKVLLPYAMTCLLYTSPSPRDGLLSRMPSSA